LADSLADSFTNCISGEYSQVMSHNPWSLSIAELHRHAELWARWLRIGALILGLITLAAFLALALFVFYHETVAPESIPWAIARLSGLALVGAFLLFLTRTVWNYSNVWLGRAGTLEDLTLALRLLDLEPDDSEFADPKTAQRKMLVKGRKIDAHRLKTVVESLALLRRQFEGELLAGPPLDGPKKSDVTGK
jgi:hypothetical protein